MIEDTTLIGRVLRASTRGFACGTHSTRIGDNHTFGSFVKVPVTNDASTHVIGLIYSVDIKDDQLISELVMADSVDSNVLRDQRENRMVPVEISILSIGYMNGTYNMHSLPPRPPLSLSEVHLCTPDEIFNFTKRQDFFRLVLSASEVPVDDLLAAALRYAAWQMYHNDSQAYRDFMIHCGRQLARLLARDLQRLEHILALIRP